MKTCYLFYETNEEVDDEFFACYSNWFKMKFKMKKIVEKVETKHSKSSKQTNILQYFKKLTKITDQTFVICTSIKLISWHIYDTVLWLKRSLMRVCTC